jgi:hypothetical protein
MSHHRLNAALLVAAALAAAACTAATESSADVGAPAVTIAGEPEDCIQVSRIAGTRVHDDFTIDFEMSGGQVYRSSLPGRCPGLGFEERFAYEVHSGELCQVDTVTVLYGDRGRGATCRLGPFVPVRYVD